MALRDQGVDTVAHVRPDSVSGESWERRFASYGATVVRAGWTQPDISALLLETEPTWVFGLLGTTKKRRKALVAKGGDGAQETYESVDRDLTLMTITAACALESRPLYVYLSSLGAAEAARLPYLRVRGEVERRLVESGLAHVIAQPGFISGPDRPEDRPLERVGSIVSDGALSALAALGVTSPRDRWASISGETLARSLVEAAKQANASARVTLVSRDLRI